MIRLFRLQKMSLLDLVLGRNVITEVVPLVVDRPAERDHTARIGAGG